MGLMQHVPSGVKGLWSRASSSFVNAKASVLDKLQSAPSRLPKAPASRPAPAGCDRATAKRAAVPSPSQKWQVYSSPLAERDAGHITSMHLPHVFPAAEMVDNPLAEFSDADDQHAAQALAASPHGDAFRAQQPAQANRLATDAVMSKPEQATAARSASRGNAVHELQSDHTSQMAIAAVSPTPARKTRAAAAAAKLAVTQREVPLHSSSAPMPTKAASSSSNAEGLRSIVEQAVTDAQTLPVKPQSRRHRKPPIAQVPEYAAKQSLTEKAPPSPLAAAVQAGEVVAASAKERGNSSKSSSGQTATDSNARAVQPRRGGPPKACAGKDTADAAKQAITEDNLKPRRGRPPKQAACAPQDPEAAAKQGSADRKVVLVKPRRGRPPKSTAAKNLVNPDQQIVKEPASAPPADADTAAPSNKIRQDQAVFTTTAGKAAAVEGHAAPVKRGRGRPPKAPLAAVKSTADAANGSNSHQAGPAARESEEPLLATALQPEQRTPEAASISGAAAVRYAFFSYGFCCNCYFILA